MQTEKYKGFHIEIDDDEKTLLINGENIPFMKTAKGYFIAYQPPKPTLMESVKDYLQTQEGVEQ